MKFVGAHVSASGGVFNAPLNAMKIGAKAFALFTKNQKQWNAKPLDDETIGLFKDNLAKSGILPRYVLPHDSYLINLGHPEEEKRQKSFDAFVDELERCAQLGLDRLNFHPGSHLKQISEEECIDRIAMSMNEAIKRVEGVNLTIENTAVRGAIWDGSLNRSAPLLSGSKTNRASGCASILATCLRQGMISGPKTFMNKLGWNLIELSDSTISWGCTSTIPNPILGVMLTGTIRSEKGKSDSTRFVF